MDQGDSKQIQEKIPLIQGIFCSNSAYFGVFFSEVFFRGRCLVSYIIFYLIPFCGFIEEVFRHVTCDIRGAWFTLKLCRGHHMDTDNIAIFANRVSTAESHICIDKTCHSVICTNKRLIGIL